MAPAKAARRFRAGHPEAASFRVTLFGSLAATGRGHLTDRALFEAIPDKPVEITWKPREELDGRPGGMLFEALDEGGNLLAERKEHSLGGGALLSDAAKNEPYPEKTLARVIDFCERRNISFADYVTLREGTEINTFLARIAEAMFRSVERGLSSEGVLPGSLALPRRARFFYRKALGFEGRIRETGLLSAFALAAAEENAGGGEIVSAPTCGSSGVLPAVLFYLERENRLPAGAGEKALATAGVIGNTVKANASISGACVGCQGEIGTACAMAAGAAACLLGGNLKQVEYAAEMGLEHHLGLTCDPVDGLVQIPCIERNAYAALRAFDCACLALLSDGSHRISFDDAVLVMLETGRAISGDYRETSAGGLARLYRERIREQLFES